ncbi:MAG: hypothetical protein CMJ29_06940 [Phycisphaerae bacterium]|nr:hypothetical protein [Phycisphaerae bacterium]
MTSPRILLTALGIATAVPGLLNIASGDVITSVYNSGSSYDFEIEGMPDFDQVRTGLATDDDGEPGANFCLPTAHTNLTTYIGLHGFPSVGPDAADWENEEDYELITTYISNMASLCSTDRNDGTAHDDAYDGLVYYLNARCPGCFTVTENMATNTTGPTLRSITENNVNGAISTFGYGIYDDIGDDIWGRRVLERNGGHAVTFVRGYRDGSDREIGYNDPDDFSSAWATQSTFVTREYEVDPVSFVRASSLFAAGFLGDRNGSRIMRTDGGKFRMIDTVIHVRPRACYSWESSENGWRIIRWNGPIGWTAQNNFLSGPPANTLQDFTIGPFNNTLWFLAGETSSVTSVRLSNNEKSTFDLPHAASKLAFTRDHAMVVLGARLLSRVHPMSQSLENAPAPLTIGLADDADQMAMDDSSDSIWLMDASIGKVTRLPQMLDEPGRSFSMPETQTPVKRFAATGHPEKPLAFVTETGTVLVCKIDMEIEAFIPVDVFQIELRGMESEPFTDVQFNDEGDLLVFSEAGMDTYVRELDWKLAGDADPLFASRSVMSRNRTNFNPEIHGDESWRTVRDNAPAGDLDNDGVVGIDDLLALLAVFGDNDGEGDLDGDGITGVDDILVLLGNWSS